MRSLSPAHSPRSSSMDEDLAKRLKYLLGSCSQYSVVCPQLAAHLGERCSMLRSKAGLGGRVSSAAGGGSGTGPQACPRCSTIFTPNSTHWRTLTAKLLRSKRRRCSHGNGRGIHWLDKPLPKHTSYMVVECLVCGGLFIAGGINKPSSKRKHSSVKNSQANMMKSKGPLTAGNAVASSSPALMALSTPRERSSTPSNRGSTPSNQRRRSSTLKAQLARSSSQQRLRQGQGNSPQLSAFLTSIQ